MLKKAILKYKSMSESVKCSLYFMICNLFQKGIAFITVPIFTRMMSTDEYGQFTVFQSWTQVFIIFTSWNIAYGVLNKALTKYSDHNGYVSSSQAFYSVITIIFYGIYFCIKPITGNFLRIPLGLELMLVLETLVTPALAIYSAKARYDLKYKLSVALTMLLALLNPLIGIYFVNMSNEKGLARIFAYLLAQIVICLPVYLGNFVKGRIIFNKEFWRYTFTFSLPLIPYFLSSIILNQSDKIMISQLCGDSYAGIYGIAFSIAMLMRIVNESINASFVPWLYKRIERNSYEGIKQLVDKLIVGVAAINFVVIMFTPELIRFFGTEKYYEAVNIMPMLTMSVCLMFQASLYNNIEMFYEKNKVIMAASIAMSVLNIVLNYVFIAMFGYKAAAYTTAFCYIIMLVWHILYCNFKVKSANECVNVKTIIVTDVVFLLIVSFSSYLADVLYVRIILSLVILGLVVYKSRDVVGGLRK